MFVNSRRNLRLTSLFIDETMKLIKRYFIVIAVFFIVYLLVAYKKPSFFLALSSDNFIYYRLNLIGQLMFDNLNCINMKHPMVGLLHCMM